MIKILLTGFVFLFSTSSYAATIHCEGQPAFTKFYTSGSEMNNDYLIIESNFKFDQVRLSLVLETLGTEIYQGSCRGGLPLGIPIQCELISTSESITMSLSGRKHNVIGTIKQANGVETNILCVN